MVGLSWQRELGWLTDPCLLCSERQGKPHLSVRGLTKPLAVLQAAVVGLSCRHDVMELLEKRVRSRFSHRKQLLPELEQKDFDQPGNSPKDVLASMLTVPETGSSDAPAAEPVQEWNAAVSHVLATDAVAGQLKLMVNQGCVFSLMHPLAQTCNDTA